MKSILCYGDSNTYGLMPDSPDRYPRDVRWTGILQKKLGGGLLCNRRRTFRKNDVVG